MDKKNKQETWKKNAANEAVKLVQNNMILGLGTGSTANWFIKILAQKLKKENLNVKCVCTSNETKFLAKKEGLFVVELNTVPKIDLTVDGADEFDKQKNLIKGGGGALLKEKIVASNSKKFVIIADETKSKKKLGEFPLPIEIVQFGCQKTYDQINETLKSLKFDDFNICFRMKNGMKFLTDEGHFIVDIYLSEIQDPINLQNNIISIPGVVETGLFLKMADEIIIGMQNKKIFRI